MALPEHLDYYEAEISTSQGPEWYPHVICTIRACRWSRASSWIDLSDDSYGEDWNMLHPPHPPEQLEG